MRKKIVTYVVDNSNKEEFINDVCKKAEETPLGFYLQKPIETDYRNEKSFPELSVENNIIYYQKLYGDNSIPVEKILADFGLSKVSKLKVKKIGEKNRKKLGIAITFIGNPMYVVLDNPFENLGIETSASIKNFLVEYVEKNSALIVIVANKLIEYEELSDTVYCVKDNAIEKIKEEVL